MRYASRTKRIVGQFIDGIVAFALIMGGIVIDGLDSGDIGMLFFLTFFAAIAYTLFSDAMSGGQSLGKRAMGIAVVTADAGAPCGKFQSFVRNFCLSILGPIDWMFIFGQKHQRLGDMLAGTVVVDRS